MSNEVKIIRSRAPLRIGIAGGGTDLSSYFSKFGGNVLNATINKYAYTELKVTDSSFIAESIDHNKKVEIKNLKINKEYSTPNELKLHLAIYKKIIRLFNNGKNINCKLSTCCDAPIGSGLGSSSTLVVSMVKAFDQFLNIGLDDYQIAELAYEIERIDCKLEGGKQDQYAASFGGFNFIEFNKDNTIVNKLKLKNWFKCELESSLIIHFTGLSRSSSEVIKDQSLPDKKVLNTLHLLKKEAFIMKEAFLKCDRVKIRESLLKSWELKSLTSKKVSNKTIQESISLGLSLGAEAAKVSGAGGGGFILFLCQPCHAIKLLLKLREKSSETFFCSFTYEGAQAWNINY